MRAIEILLNPSTIAIIALLLSVIWMLRDEKDRARIELVFALVLNLFYGVFLNIFMAAKAPSFPGNSITSYFAWMRLSAFRLHPSRGRCRAFCTSPLDRLPSDGADDDRLVPLDSIPAETRLNHSGLRCGTCFGLCFT